ncbi:spastin and fidgetin-like protein [Plasmopara halstedii]|uniref:microtubule-severing ATPase n=1 Tax=Plasmopara halstedii TaxID=4781 RepID=A0A0P1B2Y7_PLAHL|nr:spastin and fidgetin-like protein [Plasmopara halstedii]CEG47722.1 spastin and fidgetin-like protein [Plasmopara halstedii]|eukprot:XP_024584091.1 spastin and fidgetin-like protein [Plasmopara halstedii]
MRIWSSQRSEDAFQKTIEEAVAVDKAGKYAEAVDLYALGIEKMMAHLAQIPDDDAKAIMRGKINEYMMRAEYLKDWTAKQARKETQISSAATTSIKNARVASERQKAGYSKQHAQLAHTILDDVLDHSPGVHWMDIAGLEVAKQILQEAVILPTMRPDLFTGLRAPPRGVLLFGPPGTGKTLLAKAVATEAKATFFNISASSLTSKWVGEGEKLVRALFDMARELQPSVVFMDEMDALLSTRSASENDASRRIKNQFFTELDGAASSQDDRILVMGATNLPQELDEAIIRRLEKRIYVPLPGPSSREGLIRHLLRSQKSSLSSNDFRYIVKATEGYSGSDLKAVCKDAALGPIRELGEKVADVKAEDVRGIIASDFRVALTRVRPSVSARTIDDLIAWNERFGVSAV